MFQKQQQTEDTLVALIGFAMAAVWGGWKVGPVVYAALWLAGGL